MAVLVAFAIVGVSLVTWPAQSFRPPAVSLEGDLRFRWEFVGW